MLAAKLIQLWEMLQIELHGSYSPLRVVGLTKFSNESSWLRVFGIVFATPMPCLFFTVITDTFPLGKPTDGLKANSVFFVREFFAFLVFTFISIHQYRTGVPILPYPLRAAIRDTVVVAALTVAVIYGLSSAIGFPLPFMMVASSPAWLSFTSIAFVIQWARKIHTPGAKEMIIDMIKMWMFNLLLACIYPVYLFTFKTLKGKGQTAFALLLPVMKLCLRNLFARVVVNFKDELPVMIVLNVELFNSLFVSYCMQSSPSIWTSLEIVFADSVVMAISLRDLKFARHGLEELEREIDEMYARKSSGRHMSGTLERVSTFLLKSGDPRPTPITTFIEKKVVKPATIGPTILKGKMTKTAPAPKLNQTRLHRLEVAKRRLSDDDVELTHSSSPSVPVLVRYSRMVRQLLYMAEFMILLNYIEVIIPIIFSTYMLASFHLPNRDYYYEFDGKDQSDLFKTLQNVMVYGVLQLVSFLLLIAMLQHMLGVSPIRQLAFVLYKEVTWVQIFLVFWLLYNAQGSLQHAGFDYTFQFAWLHEEQERAT